MFPLTCSPALAGSRDEIDNRLRKCCVDVGKRKKKVKSFFSYVELDVWCWLLQGRGTCVYVKWIVYMCSRERLCIIVCMKDNMRVYICVYTGVHMYVSAWYSLGSVSFRCLIVCVPYLINNM